MSEFDDERLVKLLRSALPPASGSGCGADRDRWPLVIERIEQKQTRFSWLDWALAGATAAAMAACPEIIPGVALLL